MKRIVWFGAFSAVIGALLNSGCAKFPANGFNTFTTRLIFTMRLSGAVQWGQNQGKTYVYLFPIRVSTDVNPSGGPEPVVSGVSGSGNGMVTGVCTDFILYDPTSPNPYQIWHFQDTNLTAATLVGYAISRSDPRNTTTDPPSVLQCEMDMSQIVPVADVSTIKSVQINFLTMDRRALNGTSHSWDALGDSRLATENKRYLRFDLNNNRIINNTQTSIEPPTIDVNDGSGLGNDSDLDMVDWSIEIQRQQ